MGSTPSVTTTYAYDKIAMLVTLLAEHWPLSTTYKLDWRSWLLGNSQLKVISDRQCRFLVSVLKFTDNGSNSRVWMPGGSEDKDGGQGRCRYQWYTNTTHCVDWLPQSTHSTECTPSSLHCADTKVQDHVTHWQDRFKGWAMEAYTHRHLTKLT